MELNEEQIHRYSRHLILTNVGIEGQEKILKGKVLVIGAGGLGSPILYYLAAAGVFTGPIRLFTAAGYTCDIQSGYSHTMFEKIDCRANKNILLLAQKRFFEVHIQE